MPRPERRPVVSPLPTGGELLPKRALLLGRGGERRPELRLVRGGPAPALDTACGLEAGDRRHEVGARHVEGRGERLALAVVRLLLGYGRAAERAADGDAPKGARNPAELERDERSVIHRS